MATPLHHDQPQQSLRSLLTLKSNPKKNAENPTNSQCITRKPGYSQANTPAIQTPHHAENLTNPPDSQYRRSAHQQLPPRPPSSPTHLHHRQEQQYLRHRPLHHRSELSSPDRPHTVRSLEEPGINTPVCFCAVNLPEGEPKLSNHDRSHAVKSLEIPGLRSHNCPHVISPPEVQIHRPKLEEQLSLLRHPDCLNVVSAGEGHLHHAKISAQSSSHPHHHQQLRVWPELHSPYAIDPMEGHLQNAKEAVKHQPTQSLATPSVRDSHPRDYKAAIMRQALPGDIMEQHHHIHHEQPHLQHSLEQSSDRHKHELEDCFGCTRDEKQRDQGKSSQLDQPHQAEKQQQHVLDSPEMRCCGAEEGLDICCGNHSHTPSPLNGHLHYANLAEQHQQKQSHNHLAKPLMELHDREDQPAGDLEASDHNSHAESGTTPSQCHHCRSPRQLPQCQPELSLLARPEDSYFHISKEAVEQDYENDCHLAACPTNHEHHAEGQQQQSFGHVYDYSLAGVTLAEDGSNKQQLSDLPEKHFSDEKGSPDHSSDNKIRKDGLLDCEQRDTHDDHLVMPEHQREDVESPPLLLVFNQNSTRFACGTSKGFRVYDIDTMKECFSGMVGGVGLVELLLCTNTLLLVGGGPNPGLPPNKVIIWDALKQAYCGDLSQKFPILAVKVRQDRLVVVVENEVFIYNYSNAKLLFQVNTILNTKGLCAISIMEGPSILACLGLKKGEVRIEHIGTNRGREESPTRNSIVISAHDSGLACMALTLNGSLLATASDRGTLIRVFSTLDGTPLQEVRRGVDRAEIYSIAFSSPSNWLAVSSDKGTVHIFGLKTAGSKSIETNNASSTIVRNPGSTLSFIKGMLPKYFSSEWSFAQFKLPEEVKSVVAFGQEKHSILILGTNGSFYKCSFDPEHGGDMKQLENLNFMKS